MHRTAHRRRARRAISTIVVLLSVGLHGGPAGAEQASAPAGSGRGRAATLDLGGFHTCLIRGGGSPLCWGHGAYGQLGNGLADFRGDEPGEVTALAGVDVGSGRVAVSIAGGEYHSCAILDDASVKCWGYGPFGQLGYGDINRRGDQPGEMGDNLPAVNLGTGRTATAISAGNSHTCAILDDGSVKCWGDSGHGQLGQGGTDDRGDQPGEMGDNLPTVNLGTGRTATAITTGLGHTCAILDDGSVKCWGYNGFGLGYGDTNNRGDQPGEMGDNLPAVNLGTGRTATALTAGLGQSCAILDDGSVKCWGYNAFGQLGYGDTNNRGDQPGEMGDTLPTVDLGTSRTATAIGAGEGQTCAILDTASVKCWGSNFNGQLGYGDTTYRGDNAAEMGDFLAPVPLGIGRTATAIGVGGRSTCVVVDDGRVKCWGDNLYGQLGYGDTDDRGELPGEMGDNLPFVPFSGNLVAGAASPPAPPSGVSASGGSGSWTASWIAPVDTGSGPITGYVLQRSADGVTWTSLATTSGRATSSTAPGTAGDQFRVRVAARNAAGTSPYSAPSAVLTVGASPPVVTLDPARILDTRPGGATIDNQSQPGAALPAGATIEVQIAGRGGVPADAPAALINVTVVGPDQAGFATVYPCGPLPNASSLNFQPGRDIANAVVARLSPTGSVCIYTSATAHYLIDVNDYTPSGSTLTTLDPARVLDTRPGGATVDNQSVPGAALPAGATIEVQIAGRGGVPANATAAVLNVTSVGAEQAGFASVFPCDQPPNASNLNYQPGNDIPNAVVAKLSATGSVCIFTSATGHYLIDVNGYTPAGSTLATIQPARLLDTRPGGATIHNQFRPALAVPAGGTIEVMIHGRGGVPETATAAVLNVTAVGSDGAGYATVHPCGTPPNASNINYQPGNDIPNAVVAKLSATGSVCIYTSATAHYLIDVNGYV